jgi:hypothetical protein
MIELTSQDVDDFWTAINDSESYPPTDKDTETIRIIKLMTEVTKKLTTIDAERQIYDRYMSYLYAALEKLKTAYAEES